ncbi:MAG TPA: DUF1648 domain-containing protein [Amnibacterium sp.]|jgi:uncharacterized membrane protein|uniref:DUF1648 domain-containing protein n=1 Tax=Amnibacterium sp. TaxID=1872496 RepID=UPI002F95ED3D
MTLAIVLCSALLALVLAIGLALPSIADPTVPFGVRIPPAHVSDPAITKQIRLYRGRLLGSGVLAAAGSVTLYSVTGETLMLPLSVLVLVGAWYGCFVLAHHGIRAAKAAGGWYEGTRQGIAVDTELRTRPPRFPWLWLAPPLIITIATVLIGVVRYPSMPEILAVHYTANGVPDRLAVKSVSTAFSLVFVQVGLTALLVGIAAAIFHSRADLDPARPAGSARWFRRYTVLGAKALLGLAAMIDLGMLASSLLMWSGTITPWAPLTIVVPVLAGVLVAVIVLARNNRDWEPVEEGTGLVHRDDDKQWRGGLLYINRADHALFVPRRYGLGWTVNAGNPQAAILLAGIAGLITLLIVLRLGR